MRPVGHHEEMQFDNRADAGDRLAERLRELPSIAAPPPAGIVVLGLPRGGVPVAAVVARVLHAPLDVILVRKIGVPAQPELAMGAIGEDDVRVFNDDVIRGAHITREQFAAVESRERAALARRAELLRRTRPRVALTGRLAIIVDDGIATGSTARAACLVARAHGGRHIVLAAPVAPPNTVRALLDAADEVVTVESPQHFFAIGEFYRDFSPTSDEEVVALLAAAGYDNGDERRQP